MCDKFAQLCLHERHLFSGESKVLVFSWVWLVNMRAPYILSADDLDDFSGIYRKPSILAAEDFLGA